MICKFFGPDRLLSNKLSGGAYTARTAERRETSCDNKEKKLEQEASQSLNAGMKSAFIEVRTGSILSGVSA
jgi:hypothetical protein